MAIDIKSPKEVEAMQAACQMAADTLLLVGEKLRAGMTTEDINTLVHEDTLKKGGRPAPLNYRGFPKSVCTSINEVVCHGIPGPQVLKDGDIINVDITTIYDGYYGDTSATFYIGTPSAEARKVVEVARKSLELGIARGQGRRASRRHRRGDPGVRRRRRAAASCATSSATASVAASTRTRR